MDMDKIREGDAERQRLDGVIHKMNERPSGRLVMIKPTHELLEEIVKLNTENALLKAKLEKPMKCNSGHERWPLKLWDCPDCTEKLRAQIAKLNRVVEAARDYYLGGYPHDRERLFNALAALDSGKPPQGFTMTTGKLVKPEEKP